MSTSKTPTLTLSTPRSATIALASAALALTVVPGIGKKTAGRIVLELAEKFASIKNKLKRSVIFVSFSGEELGLLGSNYFVDKLSIPYKNITAMINLDMIGRMNDENNLIIYGTGTSHVWKDDLNNLNQKYINILFIF